MVKLPTPLTTLVGRERDVAAVADLLGRSRLVTVVGPPGVGKTRVGLAVASAVAAEYEGAACLVDVTDAADRAALCRGVTAGLGLQCDGDPDPLPRLVDHLRDRHLLLVVDNCEHLAAACAELAAAMAQACPRVSVLCTSRHVLGVGGEHVWPVAGLPVDGPASPAVRLFLDRARAQRPGFSLGPQDAPAVVELCRRLDGLPLGIELAAARIGALAPQELLARLEDGFGVLGPGGAAVPAHHRTLGAALDSSHDLLSAAEAVLFRRVAVFAGGFTLAAAESACSAPPLRHDDVLESTVSLVAKSLVVAEMAGAETRYRLLETVRRYAADRLAAATEEQPQRERHARWIVSFVAEAEPNLRRPSAKPWLTRLTAEYDNVLAALEWTVAADRADWALAIATGMTMFWRKTRRYGAGVDWLTRALALPDQRDQPPRRRVEALVALGSLISDSGDRSGAIGPLEDARRLAQEHGDDAAEGRALGMLGYSRLFVDVPTRALRPLERSTEKARAVGDRGTFLGSLSSAGWAAMFGGDARAAEARFRDCLAAAQGDEHAGPETWPAVVGLGCTMLAQGRSREAEEHLGRALAMARRGGSRQAQAVAWCFLGQLARARGDYDRACDLLGEALSDARDSGNPFAIAMRLGFVGTLAHELGDLDGAEGRLLEGLALAAEAEVPFPHAHCLVSLAGLRVTQGRAEEAGSLLDEAAALATARNLGGGVSAALLEQSRLRRLQGDLHEAARAVTEAIRLQDRLGDVLGLVDALEVLAGVRARQGRARAACRLFGAASTARRNVPVFRPPVRASAYQRDVEVARGGLTSAEWDAAWAGGRSLSVAAAAAIAVKHQGRRDSSARGWDAVTPAEREVVALVAQGLTNREVADRLVVSPRTVESHVAHVLTKVGVPSRRELARVAAARRFG